MLIACAGQSVPVDSRETSRLAPESDTHLRFLMYCARIGNYSGLTIMAWNLARTLFGYTRTLFGKYTGLRSDSSELEGIFNYVRIDDRVATSGQPTAAEFQLIRDAGFRRVVILLPSDSENSLDSEPQVCKDLEMDYIHIPVDFSNPTEDDFSRFVSAMRAHEGEPIWIHCAVNARVSAFMFRYRTSLLGEDADEARRDMEKIWQPFGVWKKFLAG